MASMNSAPAPETLVMETSELVPVQEEEAARGRGDSVPIPSTGRLLGHSNSSDNIVGSRRHPCHNNNNTSQVGVTALYTNCSS